MKCLTASHVTHLRGIHGVWTQRDLVSASPEVPWGHLHGRVRLSQEKSAFGQGLVHNKVLDKVPAAAKGTAGREKGTVRHENVQPVAKRRTRPWKGRSVAKRYNRSGKGTVGREKVLPVVVVLVAMVVVVVTVSKAASAKGYVTSRLGRSWTVETSTRFTGMKLDGTIYTWDTVSTMHSTWDTVHATQGTWGIWYVPYRARGTNGTMKGARDMDSVWLRWNISLTASNSMETSQRA